MEGERLRKDGSHFLSLLSSDHSHALVLDHAHFPFFPLSLPPSVRSPPLHSPVPAPLSCFLILISAWSQPTVLLVSGVACLLLIVYVSLTSISTEPDSDLCLRLTVNCIIMLLINWLNLLFRNPLHNFCICLNDKCCALHRQYCNNLRT